MAQSTLTTDPEHETSMPSSLTPPGITTPVIAERVLVLAPHPDDELFGCGGLLRQLVEAGAGVEILFLTDGGGGVESVDGAVQGDSAARPTALGASASLSARRLGEARAVADMAGWEITPLNLRDGSLSTAGTPLQEGIRQALERREPDLILVPSPLELTPDHRTAFDALFEVLHRLRNDDAETSWLSRARILAYEVNHAGHPNVLVDVSAEVPWLERAVALYPSQLGRHNYSAATLGLRRFRTLTLGPEVDAAEGYYQLSLEDFTQHSLSTLVESMGAHLLTTRHQTADISLIVRTFNRPELLREALRSVAANRVRPSEVIVVNDGGSDPFAELGSLDLPFTLRAINLPSNRGRSAAANAGLEQATAEFVAFLDDDDVLYPEHFLVLTEAVRAAGVRVAYTDAAVTSYRLHASEEVDGRDQGGWRCDDRRLPYSRDFDPIRLLVDNYIPFHTLLIERLLVREAGPFDEDLRSFEDWDFLIRLSLVHSFHHVRRTTCEYRHFHGSGHHALGTLSDTATDFLSAKAKVLAKHAALLTPEALASVVTGMRREVVLEEHRAAELSARWDSDRLGRVDAERRQREEQRRQREEHQARVEAERKGFALNGEVVALRSEEERLRGEIHRQGYELQRRYDEEVRLRSVAEDQSDHLERTYHEITRLNSIIETMEGTKAWRLHQLLQRRKP